MAELLWQNPCEHNVPFSLVPNSPNRLSGARPTLKPLSPSIHICCVIEELECHFGHYTKYCASPFQAPQQLMILCFGNYDLQQI